MKMRRYSLRFLFVASAITAMAFWWVRLPEYTARRFISSPTRFATVEIRKSRRHYLTHQEVQAFLETRPDPKLEADERSFSDVVFGRQTFTIGTIEFTIVRGKLHDGPVTFFESVMRAYY